MAQDFKIAGKQPFEAATNVAFVMDVELLKVFGAVVAPGMLFLFPPAYRLPVARSKEVAIGHVAQLLLIEPVVDPDGRKDENIFLVRDVGPLGNRQSVANMRCFIGGEYISHAPFPRRSFPSVVKMSFRGFEPCVFALFSALGCQGMQ